MQIKSLSLIICLFFYSTNLFSQWQPQNSGVQNNLISTSFVDENNGWIVGSNGTILNTTNGGADWNIKPMNSNPDFLYVKFKNINCGIILGQSGHIYKTTNGGGSWELKNSNTTGTLRSLCFRENTWYAVGGDFIPSSIIVKSTDDGETWINQQVPTSNLLTSVYFVDENIGYATGVKATIVKTTDGGNNWYNLFPNTGQWLYSICFVDQNVGWAVGGNEYSEIILKTTNGGNNWIIQSETGDNKWLQSVSFVNSNLGFAVGGDIYNSTGYFIYKTTNGGLTWDYQRFSSNSYLNSILMVNEKVGYCTGTNGLILKTANGGIPVPRVKALLTVDSLYFDSGFKGFVTTQISGINSTGENLSFNWLINDTVSNTEVSPFVIFHTGVNKIKLTVTSQSGVSNSDSMYTNVVASRNITGGAIYSGVSQFNDHFYTTSADKGVYEIDSTGQKLKTFLTGGSIQSVLSISPQGKLFTGSTDTRLYGFDTSLIPLWDRATGGIIASAPALSYDGSTVYCVTSTSTLLALDVQSGTIKWGFQTDGVVTNSPVVFLDKENKNILYAGTSKGVLYALRDRGNAYEIFWQKQLSDTIFSSVAIYPDGDNSMIYLGSKGGYLYRMKWDGVYDDSWKVNLNSPVYSSPVIDGNGSIYIGTKNGKLSEFTKDFTSSSSPLSSITLESGITGTPAIGNNGNIYAGTEKGLLYSLNSSSQSLEIKWRANLYSSIMSSALVTGSGLVYIGTLKGDIFVLKEYSEEISSMPKAVWPTFKGDNLRSKVLGTSITGINDKVSTISDFKLQQNYPNPFNPSTLIKFSIPQRSQVKLTIYNQLGEVVEELVNKEMEVGDYNITWNPHNISSGVYFYQIKTNKFVSTKKAIFIK